MITYLLLAITAFIACVTLNAGENLRSGIAKQMITSGGNASESRIVFEYFPYSTQMKEYQKTINKYISLGVQFRSPDEADATPTAVLDDQYFTHALVNLARRFYDFTTSMPDGNHAPWTIIDSTIITDPIVIRAQQTSLAQVVRTRYEFSGGAHGNSTVAVAQVSTVSGKQLSFANDIVTNLKAFTKIAERYFRKARRISPSQSLKKAGYWFERGFTLSQNVLISGDVVSLIYNPYECAPYMMGQIRVDVPLVNVEKYLKIPF